ncbi:MAG: zf-HC2 domain-containing protein [Gemmatimonadales bacterium]
MNHANDDELLLLAYGELPPTEVARVERHLAECGTCRAQFTRLDAAHVALDVAIPPPRRLAVRWIAAGLAAAAVLAAVWLTNSPPSRPAHQGWRPTSGWSATAGYITGGRAMVEIDAQLTRLEQESLYGRP